MKKLKLSTIVFVLLYSVNLFASEVRSNSSDNNPEASQTLVALEKKQAELFLKKINKRGRLDSYENERIKREIASIEEAVAEDVVNKKSVHQSNNVTFFN